MRVAPAPPALIPKGLASEGLLAYIATAKFCDALPLYRQEQQFARLGVELSRRTMADWMIAAAAACAPLLELLLERLRSGPKLQAPGNPSIRVEVKCSAYVQGWRQDGFTKPQFDTAPSRNLDDPGSDPEHQADVYVYCLLAHRNRETVDPLDLDQWEFYVLPRSTVEELSQKSVGLSRLRDLTLPVPYVALRTAIYSAAMGRLTSPASGPF